VSSSQADGVRALASPLAAAAGLVVEEVTVTPAGRRRVLRVTVDLPEDRTGGVPMAAVTEASQAISAALDASDVMGGAPYVLEVSSPGVDRPLTERRHWARARGRLVTVLLADGGEAAGRLEAVDDAGLTLAGGGAPVPWDQVRKGRVEIEFNRIDDADPGGDADDEADAAADDAVDAGDAGAAGAGEEARA
jgi:ribosome maturation factor RimP